MFFGDGVYSENLFELDFRDGRRGYDGGMDFIFFVLRFFGKF